MYYGRIHRISKIEQYKLGVFSFKLRIKLIILRNNGTSLEY